MGIREGGRDFFERNLAEERAFTAQLLGRNSWNSFNFNVFRISLMIIINGWNRLPNGIREIGRKYRYILNSVFRKEKFQI